MAVVEVAVQNIYSYGILWSMEQSNLEQKN